ncbi:MAG TPA: hypothetical protein VET88_11860 [Gammaproteobacteria bacterium]|nr:hypothetical protein [Gammaproteobacteria bacterium]
MHTIIAARPTPTALPAIWITLVFMAMFTITLAGCSRDDASLEELRARVEKLEAAAPGVGATMAAVQIHFGKLYFAAQAQNWGLAGYELYEVEENLEKAVALRPEEHGVNLASLTGTFMQTQLASLGKAIEGKDTLVFQGAYEEAISACNACHIQAERPFLLVTLPKAPPVTNQQWAVPEH